MFLKSIHLPFHGNMSYIHIRACYSLMKGKRCLGQIKYLREMEQIRSHREADIVKNDGAFKRGGVKASSEV